MTIFKSWPQGAIKLNRAQDLASGDWHWPWPGWISIAQRIPSDDNLQELTTSGHTAINLDRAQGLASGDWPQPWPWPWPGWTALYCTRSSISWQFWRIDYIWTRCHQTKQSTRSGIWGLTLTLTLTRVDLYCTRHLITIFKSWPRLDTLPWT